MSLLGVGGKFVSSSFSLSLGSFFYPLRPDIYAGGRAGSALLGLAWSPECPNVAKDKLGGGTSH